MVLREILPRANLSPCGFHVGKGLLVKFPKVLEDSFQHIIERLTRVKLHSLEGALKIGRELDGRCCHDSLRDEIDL